MINDQTAGLQSFMSRSCMQLRLPLQLVASPAMPGRVLPGSRELCCTETACLPIALLATGRCIALYQLHRGVSRPRGSSCSRECLPVHCRGTGRSGRYTARYQLHRESLSGPLVGALCYRQCMSYVHSPVHS